jgi:hypothetical protein
MTRVEGSPSRLSRENSENGHAESNVLQRKVPPHEARAKDVVDRSLPEPISRASANGPDAVLAFE